MEPGHHKARGSRGNADVGSDKQWPVMVNACLLVITLSGAAILGWWVVEFHPSNRQLWMVPLGLVMAGTPVVAWFSVFASSACHRPNPPAASRAPDQEKYSKLRFAVWCESKEGGAILAPTRFEN